MQAKCKLMSTSFFFFFHALQNILLRQWLYLTKQVNLDVTMWNSCSVSPLKRQRLMKIQMSTAFITFTMRRQAVRYQPSVYAQIKLWAPGTATLVSFTPVFIAGTVGMGRQTDALTEKRIKGQALLLCDAYLPVITEGPVLGQRLSSTSFSHTESFHITLDITA